MKGSFEEKHRPDQDSDLETKLTQDFYKQLNFTNSTTSQEFQNEEEEEFSFACGGANASPIAAEDVFINGQIKPIFDRDLSLHENLPPVKKLFVEKKYRADRRAVEVSAEVCKKSNSTGFSKIWRFKDFLGRSNSDGSDAFVFLNNDNISEKKVKKKKGKTASLSAHEVYLRSKAKDGEKRRRSSYLPYRPELMGFFTNVHSGFSKNVHPY